MARTKEKNEWRKPGRRHNYRVLAPERHFIVCEGEKTEPLYFTGMRNALKPEFRNRIHIVVRGTGLHALWSNPCVEIWLLLHFGYTTAEMTSGEAIAKVDTVFRRELKHPYTKTGEGLFNELRDRMHKAEENADRLKMWHENQGSHLPSKMNPGTALPGIIRMLSEYIDEGKSCR